MIKHNIINTGFDYRSNTTLWRLLYRNTWLCGFPVVPQRDPSWLGSVLTSSWELNLSPDILQLACSAFSTCTRTLVLYFPHCLGVIFMFLFVWTLLKQTVGHITYHSYISMVVKEPFITLIEWDLYLSFLFLTKWVVPCRQW